MVDGTFHEVDSSELAFKMAGIFALKEAVKKAGAVLLEPIMKVEVTTPDEYQGDLLAEDCKYCSSAEVSGIPAFASLTV